MKDFNLKIRKVMNGYTVSVTTMDVVNRAPSGSTKREVHKTYIASSKGDVARIIEEVTDDHLEDKA